MALFDNPPHTVTIEKPTSSTDAGGGTASSYSTRTSGVKGYMESASAAEKELFAQMGIEVSGAFSTRDTSAQRGDRLLYNGVYLRVVGINVNEAAGTIPTLCRIMVSQQL